MCNSCSRNISLSGSEPFDCILLYSSSTSNISKTSAVNKAKQTEENSAIKWITYETWLTHFELLARNLLYSHPKKSEPSKETYETGPAARNKLKTRIHLAYGGTETTQNFCIIFCGFSRQHTHSHAYIQTLGVLWPHTKEKLWHSCRGKGEIIRKK